MKDPTYDVFGIFCCHKSLVTEDNWLTSVEPLENPKAVLSNLCCQLTHVRKKSQVTDGQFRING